jgi:hypothetical protein
MDPYKPPKSFPGDPVRANPAVFEKRGRPCASCGSPNTGDEVALRPKPGIFTVMLFGWVFLLIRAAFSRQTETCHDCGAIRRYKTSGSWLAMAFLLLIAALFGLSFLIEPD